MSGGGGGPSGSRPPLASKALSEGFARLRYRDTSLLIWQQQQQQLLAGPAQAPPPPTGSYLRRSRSAWYSQYGNQAVLVRDKARLRRDPAAAAAPNGPSRFCALM